MLLSNGRCEVRTLVKNLSCCFVPTDSGRPKMQRSSLAAIAEISNTGDLRMEIIAMKKLLPGLIVLLQVTTFAPDWVEIAAHPAPNGPATGREARRDAVWNLAAPITAAKHGLAECPA